MRSIGVVVAALALGASACTGDPGVGPVGDSATAGEGAVTIAREIDGDSLELFIDGDVVEVRLLGVNAPELADCQGPAAGAALVDLLRSGPISVEVADTDRFGRALVWLRVGSLDVNREMVRAGWALANHGDGDHLEDDMEAAADAGLGMWNPTAGDCDGTDVEVLVVDAQPDPPGPDDERINDEYVVLENGNAVEVDLTGWILRDESTSNRLVFDDVMMAPGARLTVRSGCGTDTDDEYHWCSSSPVWSNRGETALLLGPDGSYVSHLFF